MKIINIECPILKAQLEHDPELIAQGWERRFTAEERRTKEVVELYSHMGYEVLTEPVRAKELDDDCQDCRSVVPVRFHTIFTRRPKERAEFGEMLVLTQ